MLRIICGLFLIHVLLACSATPNPSNTTDHTDHLVPPIKSAKQWQDEIVRFQQLKSIDVYARYLDIIRSFDDIAQNQLCTPANIDKLHDALNLNPTSLIATMNLYRCASHLNQLNQAQNLLANATQIAQQLIADKNGQSEQQAIYIREIDEAFLILDIAAFKVLGSEIVTFEDRFMYKIHTVDQVTGKFRYQYFDNSDFMHAIHNSAIANSISKQDSVNIALESYRKNNYAAMQIRDVRQLLLTNHLAQAKTLIDGNENLAPLMSVIRLDIANHEGDYATIAAQLDSVYALSNSGSMDAQLSMIDILLRYGETKEEFQYADQSFKKMITLTNIDDASQRLLEKILAHPNPNKTVDTWWRATSNKDLVSAIGRYFQHVQPEAARLSTSEIELLQFSARYKNTTAMFVLGQYYLQQHPLVETGKKLLTTSAELGFTPAQIYINEHF